ncbi:MAG: hypothetical protein P1V97_32975 [Planctomycetota bacterium]|nr:hypothetical protein [Planctomycetota bacterium]
MDSVKLNDETCDFSTGSSWDQDEGSEQVTLGQSYDPFDAESFLMLLLAKRWDVLSAIYLPKESEARRLFEKASDREKRTLIISYRGAMRESWPSQSSDAQ